MSFHHHELVSLDSLFFQRASILQLHVPHQSQRNLDRISNTTKWPTIGELTVKNILDEQKELPPCILHQAFYPYSGILAEVDSPVVEAWPPDAGDDGVGGEADACNKRHWHIVTYHQEGLTEGNDQHSQEHGDHVATHIRGSVVEGDAAAILKFLVATPTNDRC